MWSKVFTAVPVYSSHDQTYFFQGKSVDVLLYSPNKYRGGPKSSIYPEKED